MPFCVELASGADLGLEAIYRKPQLSDLGSRNGFFAFPRRRNHLDNQGLSPQSFDSTRIIRLFLPCNRIKAEPFGWTSSSLDPVARRNQKHQLQPPPFVKFHTKRRGAIFFRVSGRILTLSYN